MTSWTVAQQVLLSMDFSRQEYGNGLPFPLQMIFRTQGSKLHLLSLLYWQKIVFTIEPSGKSILGDIDIYIIYDITYLISKYRDIKTNIHVHV